MTEIYLQGLTTCQFVHLALARLFSLSCHRTLSLYLSSYCYHWGTLNWWEWQAMTMYTTTCLLPSCLLPHQHGNLSWREDGGRLYVIIKCLSRFSNIIPSVYLPSPCLRLSKQDMREGDIDSGWQHMFLIYWRLYKGYLNTTKTALPGHLQLVSHIKWTFMEMVAG